MKSTKSAMGQSLDPRPGDAGLWLQANEGRDHFVVVSTPGAAATPRPGTFGKYPVRGIVGSGYPASMSAGDHAHEDAVLAHKVMVERAADMYGHEGGRDRADQAVNREQLLGEQAILGQIGGNSNPPSSLIGSP